MRDDGADGHGVSDAEDLRLAAFLVTELGAPGLTSSDDPSEAGRPIIRDTARDAVPDRHRAGSSTSGPTYDERVAAAWAASGAMWLTGHSDGPPLAPGRAVMPTIEAAARAATRLAATLGIGGPLTVDSAELLTGRAGLLGLRRRGRTSANGSCRLLAASDGWVAVNLARPSDVDAVPALIERLVTGDTWAVLADAVPRLSSATVIERAAPLGLPAAALPEGDGDTPTGPFVASKVGAPRPQGGPPTRLVVDLSAMWAGPLCARLLGLAGLRVVKVESTTRPDGARAGDGRFFSWLHGGHESVAVDLSSDDGRRSLRALLEQADVVIESSRPRALAQLGFDAEEAVASRPGMTWVSITGHGRRDAVAGRVAFGDDAAVAAGLVARDERGDPVFCGDAIADPLTGLYAAVGALASLAAGGGYLLDVAMVTATSFAASVPVSPIPAVEVAQGEWQVPKGDGLPRQPVVRPAPPAPASSGARPLGADTPRVLAELGIREQG